MKGGSKMTERFNRCQEKRNQNHKKEVKMLSLTVSRELKEKKLMDEDGHPSQRAYDIAVSNLDEHAQAVLELYEHAEECRLCVDKLKKAQDAKIKILTQLVRDRKPTLGFFLSLEGIDFTWKTPFTEWLKRDFSENREVVITRDPPYLLPPWNEFKGFFERGEQVSHLAEALLLLTARVDNNERVILPALSRGALVIADRYFDSWFAYQTVRLARYFTGSQEKAQEFLFNLNRVTTENGFLAQPNLTILITDDPQETIKRKSEEKTVSKYDVLEIQRLVDIRYQKLAEMFPERIVSVDVRGKNIDEAYAIIKVLVGKWLEKSDIDSGPGIFPEIETIQIGNRLMALRRISWTLYEFDDYPLVIESGDLATVISVERSQGKIIVEWDKDEFKHLPKSLNLMSKDKFSCVVI